MRLDCGDWWTPDGDEDPRIVTVRDARRLGYTRSAIEHRVRTGRWRRVLPRTYLTAGTLIWPDRQRAALAFAGAGALLTGAAALADAELRCVRPPDQILVLVPAARRVRSTGFVRIRATNRMPERALLPGPARVPLGRAVADLALEKRRLDDVRALVGESVRKRLCTVDELVAELESGPRNGSAHLRDAVEEIARGAWSAPEARAATVLRRSGVPRFEQNVRIVLPGGRHYVADFLWRELRAILEIDSVEHHFDAPFREATMQRHLVLETLGYSVIHVAPATVFWRPAGFAADVRRWLAGRSLMINSQRAL